MNKKLIVDSEFYNRFSRDYIREHKPNPYSYEGILPTSVYKINVQDISTLARGAVSGDLRRYIIEKHTILNNQNQLRPYQKRMSQ